MIASLLWLALLAVLLPFAVAWILLVLMFADCRRRLAPLIERHWCCDDPYDRAENERAALVREARSIVARKWQHTEFFAGGESCEWYLEGTPEAVAARYLSIIYQLPVSRVLNEC
jgi:hypothetical protein